MEAIIETRRLILREIVAGDEDGLSELETDTGIQRYPGTKPVRDKEQIRKLIASITAQYRENGTGPRAIIEKSSGKIIGWAGLRLHREAINNHAGFYDLVYDITMSHRGKGIAIEAAQAVLNYEFRDMALDEIYAMTGIHDIRSKGILDKTGFRLIETFDHEGEQMTWLRITRNEWRRRVLNSYAILSASFCHSDIYLLSLQYAD